MKIAQVIKYKEPELIPLPIMRALVEVYYDYQKQRIATTNNVMMNAQRNGISEEDLEKKYGVMPLIDMAHGFEKAVKKKLTEEVSKFKIYQDWLQNIVGIGPILAAGLLAHIENPERFENVSKLWVYAGVGMNTYCPKCDEPTHVNYEFENREKQKRKAKKLKPFSKCPKCHGDTYTIAQRKIIGYQINWNAKFKTLCWKIGEQFIKQKAAKSNYRRMYEIFRKDEEAKHPEKIKTDKGKTKFNKAHILARARNRTVKLFLSHLWTKWRELEGLEVSKPYPTTKPEHKYIAPFDS